MYALDGQVCVKFGVVGLLFVYFNSKMVDHTMEILHWNFNSLVLKSDNLQYNTLGRWDNCLIVPIIFFIFFYNFRKIKIKSFECPKSLRNYEKKILGTSDTWSMSPLSWRPSEPAYYIEDCRILEVLSWVVKVHKS